MTEPLSPSKAQIAPYCQKNGLFAGLRLAEGVPACGGFANASFSNLACYCYKAKDFKRKTQRNFFIRTAPDDQLCVREKHGRIQKRIGRLHPLFGGFAKLWRQAVGMVLGCKAAAAALQIGPLQFWPKAKLHADGIG